MAKGSEQTFSQRRHLNGQEIYEKVLNITNYQGNVNQNHNEILPHTGQNGCHKKKEITSVGEDVVNVTSIVVLQEIKEELPYDPANPLLVLVDDPERSISLHYSPTFGKVTVPYLCPQGILENI